MISELNELIKDVEIDLSVKIPASEFEGRIERLRREIEGRKVDVAVAYGNELFPGDVGWLTGYDPRIESAIVIVGKEKVLVLGGPEGKSYAEEMMRVGEFRCVEELKIPDEDYPGFEFHEFRELVEEAHGGKVRRIGVLTLPSILPCEIMDLIKSAGDVVDLTEIMLRWRYEKSENEQKLMRIAAKITTYGMIAMLKSIEVGKRETQVAAAADYVMKYLGADRFGFVTIVCSGERASNVIGRASNRRIEDGDLVVLGTSARYEGLASAIGRTIVVGKPSESKLELIRHGIRAFEIAIEKIGYGKPAREVDLSSRRYLRSVGLEPMYSAVHNIGWTECMEGYGAATQYSTFNFPKNIAMEVDVGIFGIPFMDLKPKNVGFRVEDPFLINSRGETERLTDLPPDVHHVVRG